jgi:hypothetical protein
MKRSLKKWAGQTAVSALAVLSFAAQAEPFYLDVGADFSSFGTKAAGPNTTGAFNEMNIRYNSTTLITDTNGDGVLSMGDGVVGSGGLLKFGGPAGLTNDASVNRVTNFTPSASIFNPTGPALNGFPNSWTLSFGWNDLVGTVNSSGGIDYTDGMIRVYLVAPSIFGNANANEILQLDVDKGGNNSIGQSLDLFGTVSVDAGPGQNVMHWASDLTSWFDTVVAINFESNQNTEPFYVNGLLTTVVDPNTFFNGNETGYLEASHDGSISFNRIPEPGSMALLGSALIGLASLRRRRMIV